MASVNVVYKTLKDVVNKDQQGFVTPDVFNSMAGIAQINIFNRLFDDLKDAHRNARAQFDPGRDKSLFKRINEDLSSFAKTEVIQKDQGVLETLYLISPLERRLRCAMMRIRSIVCFATISVPQRKATRLLWYRRMSRYFRRAFRR